MLKVKNGRATFVKERKLTGRQLSTIKQLEAAGGPGAKEAYVETIFGLRKESLYVRGFEKRDNGKENELAQKPKRAILRKLLSECNTNQDYSPDQIDLGQWIGVEIECFLEPKTELVFDLDEKGERIPESDEMMKEMDHVARERLRQQLQANRVRRVHVKKDGSLGCARGGFPIEVTILINAKYGFDQLHKLDKILRDNGAYVNDTCGLHVHLDARHIDESALTTISRRFEHALPLMLAMMPRHRVNNVRYCAPQVSRQQRYSAVNMQAYDKFKTVEIRVHEGSVSATDIINWIQFLQVVSITDTPATAKSLGVYRKIIPMSDHVAAYCERRINEVGDKSFLEEKVG